MRTKTLLIAAAALAATVITSEAQVYSANIVGYANTVLPAGAYSLISNPLSNGGTNGASQILTSLSPSGGETLFVWTGTGYHVYQYQGAGNGTGLGEQSDWTDGSYPPTHNISGEVYDAGNDVYWTPQPTVTPGQGVFLLNPNAAETNVFSGTVVATNSVSLPAGAYSLVSSAVPFGGDITSNLNLTANFSASGGETVFIWTGTGYHVYQYQGAGNGTGLGEQSDWTDGSYPPTHNISGEVYDAGNDVYWTPSPKVPVGQGFFVLNPNGVEQWNQGLSGN